MLVRLTIQDLVRQSAGIVRVLVLSQAPRAVEGVPRHDQGIPLAFRDSLVTVTNILRQPPADLVQDSRILIRTAQADSEARFFIGEDALVFLAPLSSDYFEFRISGGGDWGGDLQVFHVYGGFQGKFTIEGGIGEPLLYRPGISPVTFGALSAQLLAKLEHDITELERFKHNRIVESEAESEH